MAKKIKIKPIPSIEEGVAIQIPELDKDGFGIMDGRKPKTRDGTILDILEGLIRSFPTNMLTMASITEGIRLKEQLAVAHKNNNGLLTLEDSTYEWAKKMLEHENVGVKMLAFNLPNTLKAMEEE